MGKVHRFHIAQIGSTSLNAQPVIFSTFGEHVEQFCYSTIKHFDAYDVKLHSTHVLSLNTKMGFVEISRL